MPTIEFEGKNTQEAIEKACNQLHISTDELKFEIITTGSSGIFGLGGKKARIRVTIEEKITKKKNDPGEPVPATERVLEKVPSGRPARPEKSEGPRQREERREPRRPRKEHNRPPRKAETTENEIQIHSENLPHPPTVAGPGESVYEGPEDEPMILGKKALEGILQHMTIEATVQVSRIGERIILSVEGDNSGLLIGKKGATLDALQFLINKIVNKTYEEKFRVIVDTEKYRERRHQSLIDLARRMGEKARKGKRPVTISQLSANDRRVVHLALQEIPGLKTRSRGDGPMKNVVIIPGGKRGPGRSEKKEMEDTPNEEEWSE